MEQWFVWLALIIILVFIECTTVNLTTIWFVASAHSTYDARNNSCDLMWCVRSLQQRIFHGAEDHREQPAA